jgi:peptidyl-prolyl cis-trans isomerase SurA
VKISFLFIFLLSVQGHSKIVERIVAIVNDQIITESDITNYRSSLKNGQLVDDLLVTDTKSLLKSRKKLVDHIINEKLIDSEVQATGMAATVERVEQEIRTIIKRNRISRNQLKQALKEKGVVFSDYQEFVRKRLERQSLIEKAITSKIKISDDDIANYFYSKNPKRSESLSFEYTIAHILFRPKGGRRYHLPLRPLLVQTEKQTEGIPIFFGAYVQTVNCICLLLEKNFLRSF